MGANWNMFAFALCFSFFLITMTATWYSTKHYQTTKMSVLITTVATLTLFSGIAACCKSLPVGGCAHPWHVAMIVSASVAGFGVVVLLTAFRRGAGMCCYSEIAGYAA